MVVPLPSSSSVEALAGADGRVSGGAFSEDDASTREGALTRSCNHPRLSRGSSRDAASST